MRPRAGQCECNCNCTESPRSAARGGRGHYSPRCHLHRKDLAPGPLGGASNSAMTRPLLPTTTHPGTETKKRLQTTYAQCGMKRRTGESSMYVLANTRAYLCATQALP